MVLDDELLIYRGFYFVNNYVCILFVLFFSSKLFHKHMRFWLIRRNVICMIEEVNRQSKKGA